MGHDKRRAEPEGCPAPLGLCCWLWLQRLSAISIPRSNPKRWAAPAVRSLPQSLFSWDRFLGPAQQRSVLCGFPLWVRSARCAALWPGAARSSVTRHRHRCCGNCSAAEVPVGTWSCRASSTKRGAPSVGSVCFGDPFCCSPSVRRAAALCPWPPHKKHN